QAPDTQYLQPLMVQTKDNCGAAPEAATMDAGYFSADNAAWCEVNGIDAYISTRQKKPELPPPSPLLAEAEREQAEPSKAEAARAKMKQKLETDKGRKVYARRKAVVE